MILFDTKKSCCGCTACASICPKQAIEMLPDENGFFYPHINHEKCINCNLCKKVCSYQKQRLTRSKEQVFVAVSQNTNILESASGGLFASFAKTILAKGGVVYGSAMQYYNNQLHVRHIKVTDESDLHLLKGSKYVQSNLDGIFPEILSDLKKQKNVLFSGTPCQVAGLKGYLQKDYPNLYTIDLICHGVPSEKLFHQYLSFEENKNMAKITSYRFRDKTEGWKLHGSMSLDSGKTIYFEPEESSYYQLFLNSYTYRENCYSCPYASVHRPGDVTIGDYWCLELVHPELLVENGGQIDHTKGVSCMILNNDRGNKLFSLYGFGIECWKSSYEKASKYNRQLLAPSQLKDERDLVLQLAQDDYSILDKWYHKRLIPIKIKRTIRSCIPTPIKRIVKKIMRI